MSVRTAERPNLQFYKVEDPKTVILEPSEADIVQYFMGQRDFVLEGATGGSVLHRSSETRFPRDIKKKRQWLTTDNEETMNAWLKAFKAFGFVKTKK